MNSNYLIESEELFYSSTNILSFYSHNFIKINSLTNKIKKEKQNIIFNTNKIIPKIGVMLIGWGGNNGSTVTASILANQNKIKWNTKDGIKLSNYYGSLTQSSTIPIGFNEFGQTIYIPFHSILPMVNPNDIIIGGWDINSANLGDAMRRSQVS